MSGEIAAGNLDRRITLERATESRDAFNDVTLTWSPLATVWASWRPATANERIAAQEVGGEADDVFEIRWSRMAATINPKDRLIYGGRVHEIVGATEIGRREGIRIKAKARTD